MRAWIGIVILALAGCSTKSDVVPSGPGAYMVRPNAGGATNDTEIKAYGIKRANEVCDAEGKHAVITVGQSTGWHLFSVQHAEVHFYCDDVLPTRASAKSPTS
ncbi:MAG TPA: hypothetical protein VNS61_13120 [Caldimonas sp.]|nr:hypothetical protein [Caldimonas sp.]